MPNTQCGFLGQPATLYWQGPTLKVQIGFDPTYRRGLQAKLPTATYDALVDTGATQSSIDTSLAATLQLPIVNQRLMAGALGASMVNVHLCQIRVPSLGFVEHGALCGVDLAAGGQRHLALLGRSFLAHMEMIYDGKSGSVTISY